MPAKKTPPVALTPEDEAKFDAYYSARRQREEAEAKAKQPPKDWSEMQDRLRSIVREENQSFLEKLFAGDEEGDGEDTSSGRPPAEGGSDGLTMGGIMGLLGLKKAADGE